MIRRRRVRRMLEVEKPKAKKKGGARATRVRGAGTVKKRAGGRRRGAKR